MDSNMILSAVENINGKIMNHYENDPESVYELTLQVTTDGHYFIIEFLGSRLWFSDEDEREFIEEDNDYEPLEGFLIKQMRKVIKKVNSINNISL